MGAQVRHGAKMEHKLGVIPRIWSQVDEVTELRTKASESKGPTSLYRCARCNADHPESWLMKHMLLLCASYSSNIYVFLPSLIIAPYQAMA